MAENPEVNHAGHPNTHWRSQDFVLRRPENRGAVGAEFETPGEGNGERYRPPKATSGFGGAS